MRRVIKIGGSLLLRESLARDLQSWLDRQPPAETIGIVGGGALIDAVRQLDSNSPMNPSWVHWECVRLLRTTYQWLEQQLDGWQCAQSIAEFERMKSEPADTRLRPRRASHLVAVDSFYHQSVPSPLPETWDTTTDAIAGWLSIVVEADELVLLKSCDVNQSHSLRELADDQVIDSALPLLADRLPPVRFVNLAAPMRAS